MPDKPRLSRRKVLTTTGTGLAAGLAGCVGGGGGGAGGSDATETTAGGAEAGGGGAPTPGGGVSLNENGYIAAGDTGNEVHVLTDYSSNKWQTLWKDLESGIKSELDLKFELEYMGMQGSGNDRLVTLLQSGKPPETFTSSPGMLGNMLAEGQLAKVTHLFRQIKETHGMGVNGSNNRFGGEIYRFPHGKYTSTIHYRTDILEQLGLEIPETHGDLVHVASTIDDSDEFDIRGHGISAIKDGQSDSRFALMLMANGAHQFRWKTDEKEEAEVWFPKKEVLKTLEQAKELAQYSPDPTSISWGPWLKMWGGGRIASGFHLNAWGAGIAVSAGKPSIAANTTITPFYKVEGVTPFARGGTGFDGHPVIKIADNAPGMMKILKWMYEEPERIVDYHAAEPMRFIPAWKAAMETEKYKNLEVFQEHPNLIDLNNIAANEVAPKEPTAEQVVVTAATQYVDRFPITSELMNQVVVTDRDPEQAYTEAKERLEKRLAEGQKRKAI